MFLKKKRNNIALILIEISNEGERFTLTYNGKTFSLFSDLDSLIQKEKKQLLLYGYWLHISGNGVFSRTLNHGVDFKNEVVFDKNESFYFCSKDFVNKKLVTFWRESLFTNIIDYLTKEKKHLLGISGGIVPFLSNSNENYEENIDYNLVILENSIDKFERNKSFLCLSELQITKLYSSLNEHINQEEAFTQSLDLEVYKKSKFELKQHRIFNFLGVISLFLIFSTLIINKYFYHEYSKEIETNHQAIELEMNNFSLIQQLKEEKERKVLLLQTTGFISNKFLTYYIDQLISLKPEKISLSKFEILPISDINKNNGKVTLNNHLLIIAGSTKESELINDWIIKVQSIKWIENVEIVKLSRNENQYFDFNINVKLIQ